MQIFNRQDQDILNYLINHRHETNGLCPEEAAWEDWLLQQLNYL